MSNKNIGKTNPPESPFDKGGKGDFSLASCPSLLTTALLLCCATALLMCSCFSGQREADPICIYVVTFEDPEGSFSSGDILLKYNTEFSHQSQPVFDIVVVGPLTNVYGVAFYLRYDKDALKYLSFITQGILSADSCGGGVCVRTGLSSKPDEGRLIVGVTRLDPITGGIAIEPGEQVLARVYFSSIGENLDGFPVEFEIGTTTLQDAAGGEISGGWFGGTAYSVKTCI